MKVVRNIGNLQRQISSLKKQGKSIGLVPTMGYLHKGHLSLVRKARKDCKIVVVSIFVNPLQFGPREDFRKYPRDIGRDMALCQKYTDMLFLPDAKTMYPHNFLTSVKVSKLGERFCGASRPGHFKGVATVVNKLFNIVSPDLAYFGQKDAQQAIIIRKMVKDLNMPIKVKVLPTVREEDGLAMSSRNKYLSAKERKDAVVLYRSLRLAQKLLKRGNTSCKKLIAQMRRLILKTKTAKIDYIGIADPVTLDPLNTVKREALVLLAVFIGKTRLIDNILVRR